MTYEQILKEFDEYCLSASHTLGESLASVQVYNHRKSDALMLKSFLKQSFIKYLQGEVEACNQYKSYYNQSEDQFNKGKHEAMSHMINRLQAQIKELEV